MTAVGIDRIRGSMEGDDRNGTARRARRGVAQAAADWARQDGCSTTPSSSRPATGVTLTKYAGCHAGAGVELYTVAGEGHEWPGGTPLPRSLTRLLGPQSDAIVANNVMWAFFQAHPLA